MSTDSQIEQKARKLIRTRGKNADRYASDREDSVNSEERAVFWCQVMHRIQEIQSKEE